MHFIQNMDVSAIRQVVPSWLNKQKFNKLWTVQVLFAPIWTTLYIMMSVAIWKIWIKYFDKKILKIYFVHLFFNATWSVFFFGFHQIGFALINIIIILFFIIFLMKLYFVKDKLSFYLMLPYLLWSSYALILNFSIFLLN